METEGAFDSTEVDGGRGDDVLDSVENVTLLNTPAAVDVATLV